MMKLTNLKMGAVVFGALLATAAAVTAADWPQWRGPNRDGIAAETGLLKSWPAGGPALVWKATGLGGGYSGVAVVGDKIFTMGDATDACYAYCLSEATGKQIWSAKVGKTGGNYPGPRCTPTVDGNFIYVLGQWGDLLCLEAATGKEQWRKSLARDFGGKIMSDWGFAESPLVDGDKLICTPGGANGAMLALNKKTGAEIWRTKDIKDPASYSSIIIAEIAGKRQYIQLTGASVFGADAQSGEVLWRAPRKGVTAVITTPIFYDNCVYVTSYYGVGCNLFRISESGGMFKAEEVYANKVMVNHHGGVVRIGEHLYGYSDGKGWTCQNFKTGAAVWQEKGQLGKGAVTCADGRLYLRGEDKGTIVLLAPTTSGYKQVGKFEQVNRSGDKAWPHPVIAHGKLYLRDQDVLLCYNIKP